MLGNTNILFQVHSHPVPLTKDVYKCCGTNQILKSQSCCNSIGYDNNTHSCADQSNTASSNCGNGQVCSLSQTNTAYCNRCDFDSSKQLCLSVPGYYDAEKNKTTDKRRRSITMTTEMLRERQVYI